MEESRGKLEVVKNKIEEMTNQNKVLSERIELRNKEVQNKSNLKETLNGEIEEINNDTLFLEKKYKKLEEELLKYHPSAMRKGSKSQKRKGHTNGSISKPNLSISNSSSLYSNGGTNMKRKPPIDESSSKSKKPEIQNDRG